MIIRLHSYNFVPLIDRIICLKIKSDITDIDNRVIINIDNIIEDNIIILVLNKYSHWYGYLIFMPTINIKITKILR